MPWSCYCGGRTPPHLPRLLLLLAVMLPLSLALSLHPAAGEIVAAPVAVRLALSAVAYVPSCNGSAVGYTGLSYSWSVTSKGVRRSALQIVAFSFLSSCVHIYILVHS